MSEEEMIIEGMSGPELNDMLAVGWHLPPRLLNRWQEWMDTRHVIAEARRERANQSEEIAASMRAHVAQAIARKALARKSKKTIKPRRKVRRQAVHHAPRRKAA